MSIARSFFFWAAEVEEVANLNAQCLCETLEICNRGSVNAAFDETNEFNGAAERFRKLLLSELSLLAEICNLLAKFSLKHGA